MAYKHTPPLPGLEGADVHDAAYDAADVIQKHFPNLVRHDVDRDILETALRDMMVDIGDGIINLDTLNIPDDPGRYNDDGSAH